MKSAVIESRSLGTRPTLVSETTLQISDIGPWLGKVYGEIEAHLSRIGQRPAGPPFARYHREADGRFRVEAGFPVASRVAGTGDVKESRLPGGTVAIMTHVGPYDQMETSYRTLATWIESRDAIPEGDAWEVYFSEPSEPSETWRTDIVQPYRAA